MKEILENSELVSLTGYSGKKGIIFWLKINRVPFLLDRSGWPKVNRDVLAARMGKPMPANSYITEKIPMPEIDYSKIKGFR